MAISVAVEPYGDPAFGALDDAVRAAKGDDPLVPVTVVVDRGQVGLAVRRRLAGSPPGMANVRFVTWGRLGAELAVRWLSSTDRRPATPALVHEAVRSVLAGSSGLLAAVRDQPATVRALARTYHELAGVPPDALHALGAQSTRAAEVVDLVGAVRAHLAACYDEADILDAASAEVRLQPGTVSALGVVVVYLPRRLDPSEHRLLGALASSTAVRVILGATGDEGADAPARDLVARLVVVDAAAGIPPIRAEPVWGTRVCVAPSADAEVLMALRHLMRRHAEGTPLERMALLHGGGPPYPRLVHDLARRGGIPVYGTGVRTLSATVPGRVLLGALALADNDWRRDDVAAWWSIGPLLHRGRPVPSVTWDVLSSRAGVVAGLEQWRTRLAAHGDRLRAWASLAAEGGRDGSTGTGGAPGDAISSSGPALGTGARPAAVERRAAQCDEVWRFVEDTAARLVAAPATWEGWSRWGTGLLADLLGGPARRAAWPPEEVAAFDAVTEALGALASLGHLAGGPPTSADFRAAIGAELDTAAPETSRIGHGLLVGQVSDAVGLDLDVVCVVGMVDGAFPVAAVDDVLIPDGQREQVGASIPLRSARPADSRRDYLAALAAAPERVLSYPTGDQRRGRELRPARALLDTLGHLAGIGRRLYPRDLRSGALADLPADVLHVVPSFALAVTGSGEPVSPADWALRSLTRWAGSHRSVGGHFLTRADPVVADALAVRRGRRSPGFTRYDGMVTGVAVPSPGAGVVQSPTGLETYARCPRRYLFSALLGVGTRDRPEALLRISPIDRGELVHRVLERLVAEELVGSGAAGPRGDEGRGDEGRGDEGRGDKGRGDEGRGVGARGDEDRDVGGWGDGEGSGWDREVRLVAIADAEFADAERKGLTGRPGLWQIDRSAILGELRQFVRDDARHRADSGAVPLVVEERFGVEEDPGVEIDLGGSRVVRFRGRIDRVDTLPAGGLSVVDYKTGKVVDDDLDDDPVARGTRLQLPVYGLAARDRHDAGGPVDAGYWFVGKRPAPAGVTLDPQVEERLVDVLRSMVAGIEGGRFPANPGSSDGERGSGRNCAGCPFDRICPPDRVVTWRRKRTDPALAGYVAMAEPS